MILGIGGCSCSGKSTLAKRLKEALVSEGYDVVVVNQDTFYKSLDLEHWETPESLKMDEFKATVIAENAKPSTSERQKEKIVIAEGFLVFCLERNLFDLAFFVSAPYDEIKRRRDTRDDWFEWRDPEGYFEKEVYPAYLKYNDHVINCKTGEYEYFDGTWAPDQLVEKALNLVHSSIGSV